MGDLVLTILAFMPFILLLTLIVVFRIPSIKALPIVWLLTALSLLIFWKSGFLLIIATFIKGVLTTLEIIIIIFGAIFLMIILEKSGRLKTIKDAVSKISHDIRIQAIIIAWIFSSFIEGITGFGIPAAITAPLLVSLGFNPLLSVIISLIGNSTAVSFGAAGTPILIGLSQLNLPAEQIMEITKNTALIHSIASIVIPLSITYLVVSFNNKKNRLKLTLQTLPFILLAWTSFIIPYYLIATLVGPELPTIIASIFSLIVLTISAKYNILTPKNILSNKNKIVDRINIKKVLTAFSPYILIIALLLITRLVPIIKTSLQSYKISIASILDSEIPYSFSPLYSPGTLFIITTIYALIIFKQKPSKIKEDLIKTINDIKLPFISLIFAIAIVQLIINSHINPSNISSIPSLIANSLSYIFGKYYPLISPFIGLLGAFITGSNTVSNLLFAPIQLEIAKSLLIPLTIILSLQVVGGAIGNMIAIHNVLAASATVNIKNKEGDIIRKTLIISLIYALIAGIIGFILLSL